METFIPAHVTEFFLRNNKKARESHWYPHDLNHFQKLHPKVT